MGAVVARSEVEVARSMPFHLPSRPGDPRCSAERANEDGPRRRTVRSRPAAEVVNEGTQTNTRVVTQEGAHVQHIAQPLCNRVVNSKSKELVVRES